MKKIVLLFSLITIYAINITYSQERFKLIPTPLQVEMKNDTFSFTINTCIKLNYPDSFLNNEVRKIVQTELHYMLQTQKKAKADYIEMVMATSLDELKTKLKADNLNIDFDPGDEGYVLNISKKHIKIYALTDAGMFYGVQTFEQLVSANSYEDKIKAAAIYDKPDVKVRAWQDDISRGPIPTLNFLKEEIVKLSSYKLNYFTLYTEHVFKLKKHPTLAPDDGITAEEISELTEFAKQYHVELIGNFQSFGHMEKILSKPGYEYLSENHHIISPALEDSYKFLGDVYSEVASAYKGRYFNINCDETFGLGEGKSKAMVDSMGIGGVYSYHINRIDKLLKPYRKRILMWGDIVANHPEIVKNLPKDMTIISWGYHDAASFDYAIKPLAKSGLNFWVAPGISCWSQVFPDERVATINIFNYIRDGVKYGARGVLNTSWDDDGTNLFNNNWYGLIWGAELCWKSPNIKNEGDISVLEREYRLKDFNKHYDALFYGLKKATMTRIINSFSGFHQSNLRNVEGNGTFFSGIFPIYSENMQNEMHAENIVLLNRLDSLDIQFHIAVPDAQKDLLTLTCLNFAMKEVRATLMKNLLRVNLYNFLNNDITIKEEKLKEKLYLLIISLKDLKQEYISLWSRENRGWWLSENLKRFDNLINSLENIRGYCLIDISDTLNEDGRKVKLRSVFENLPVNYTLDGSEPDINSPKYTNPISITKDCIIKARVIEAEKRYDIACDSIIIHKGIGKLLRLNSTPSKYHPSYSGGGIMALLDGRTGNADNIRNGRWQGFSGQDINVEIDLGKTEKLNSFAMGFYQNTPSWVFLPKHLEIYTSDNGVDYTLYKKLTHDVDQKQTKAIKYTFETSLKGLKTRYIKVVAVYFGKLPEWHTSAGEESMLFSDEIIIR